MRVEERATIASGSAMVANEVATERLLGSVPRAVGLRARLASPLLVQRWDKETQRSFWVMSDGVGVRCLTVNGLTAREVAAIGARLDFQMGRGDFELSPQAMRDIIEAEIDVVVELVH